MKRSFKRSAGDLFRRGLCLLLSLLLLLSHLPVASAALSVTELALITGAGLPQEGVITAEISDGEEVEAVILPQDEPALPLADTAEQPSSTEVVLPEESALVAEEELLEDGTETAEISAAEEQPPVAEETPPVPDPAADPPPDGAEESEETAAPIAEGMVLQSTAYSCGPAALATLIKMMGGPNYYDQIMQLVTLDERGSNMLALQQAALSLGYQAQGWRLALPDLAGAGPLFTHVVLGGEHHFTVVLSVDEQFAYLADPTLGRMAMPLEEFALAFSGAVLKVSQPKVPAQAAGDAAAVGEEVPAEAVALETASAPLAQAVVTPEAGVVVVEAPVTAQDPVANEPLTSQPAVEPVEDALPNQPVAEALPVETDAAPVAEEIVEEAPAAEDQSASQPVVGLLAAEAMVAELVEDAVLCQAAAAPVSAESPAGYHGNEPANTHSVAEETSLALATTMLNDAEMESIFGCNIARRNWNRNRTIRTLNWNRQFVQVNWGVVRGVASIVGGSAFIVGGVVALMAPEPTMLSKVGGYAAIVAGASEIVSGVSDIKLSR